MAQYKVPQDVEADDKLIGPFGFRQFIYLIVAAAMIALAIVLFQLFPLLAIIPLPVIVFFGALALPLKKDQPMETYLAAVVSYHFKPRKRFWLPGQSEHTIQIVAPKKIEEPLTRNISQEEASHRLSFLANIIDSEGRAIKNSSGMNDSFIAENSNTQDIFETNNINKLESMINQNNYIHRTEVIDNMRSAINQSNQIATPPTTPTNPPVNPASIAAPIIAEPTSPPPTPKTETPPQTTSTNPPKPSIIELANNPVFSIQTIQKEAKRINKKAKDEEVYIALH